MIYNMKHTLTILICLFLTLDMFAAHIIGGEWTYTCLGNGVYDMSITIYRDCSNPNGAGFDDPIPIAIYRGDETDPTDIFNVPLGSFEDLEITQSNPCAIPPLGFCAQVGYYNFTVTLDEWPINETYTFVYQRCCRNNTISNIQFPGDTGISFTAELTPESQAVCNSSPTFESIPPNLVCVGDDINYFNTALDTDGDQLVYEFCAPLTGGGNIGSNNCNSVIPFPPCPPPFGTVTYMPPFNLSAPMQGDPIVNIDPNTGYISGVPTAIGQFVIGICVKEYRNGVLLGVTRRDVQLNSVVCQAVAVAGLENGIFENDVYLFDFCLDDDDKSILPESGINQPGYTFEWLLEGPETFISEEFSPNFQLGTSGVYEGFFAVFDAAECSDTASILVNLNTNPEVDFSFTYDSCIAGPIFFQDLITEGDAAISDYFWDLDEIIVEGVATPSYIYGEPGLKDVFLRVTDENGCIDEVTKEVSYQPAPAVILLRPSFREFCPPAELTIDNLSFPVDSTYTVEWDYGDGATSEGLTGMHTYEEEGVYDVSVAITSPIGCYIDSVFEDLVFIDEPPFADFNIVGNQSFTSNDNMISLENTSTNYSGFQWYIGDEWVPSEDMFDYELQDTGFIDITLAVYHPLGCTDTIVRQIEVVPEVLIYFPNAFSPNGDSVNDEFGPTGVYFGLQAYELIVYDRWGEEIFISNDINDRWDGSYKNGTDVLPNGVYHYIVNLLGPRGGPEKLQGKVSIVR